MHVKYSIIIPTLANHKFFYDCLLSIYNNSSNYSEIIIAYNGESKFLSEIKKNIIKYRFDERVVLKQFTVYGGIAKTCNEAYKVSKGMYICYIHDNVMIFEKGWEDKLSKILDIYSDIGMIGGSEPKYVDNDPSKADKRIIFKNEFIVECDWSHTISMTKREYMDKGLLFDEFYLCGLEDKDWAISFRRLGKKVYFYPIKHKHIGNQGSYSLFKENINFLSYYSKEGPRERYFLNKNKDILKKEYYENEFNKWKNMDINIKKSWWKKLYIKYYLNKIKKIIKFK